MIKLANRIQKVNPSVTLALTAKAKKLQSEGKDIVNFGAGEPDFDTPDFIKDEAILAIKSGFTKYTPTSGIADLKKSISEKFKKDNSLDYNSAQIVVSCGAKHCIYNALSVLVDPQDEVIIPNPYWVSYPEMVTLCEGRSVIVATEAKNNFKITPTQLKNSISSKTKVLILNSPSNPTGCVYSKEELEKLAEICVSRKIFVISDEIYEKLIYDNIKYSSFASLGKEAYDLTITVNGVSKAYSMTGWRIGYLGAPQEISDAISKLQDHSTSNPASISQKAALAALNATDDFTKKMCQEFQNRRDYVMQRLDKMPKLGYVRPQGAFYCFIDISKTGIDSNTFANRLLSEADVALIPGKAFGRDDYARISFATSKSQLEKGLDRIEKWLKQ